MVKKAVKSLFRAVGLELDYYYPRREEGARVAAWAARCQAGTLVDVGANIGQFAMAAIRAGFSGRVISFEPMEREHQILERKVRQFPNWEIGMRCALGDRADNARMLRSANSYSSSMLEMRDEHVRASPGSHMIGSELVPVCRLDDIDTIRSIRGDIFLKVDVQGYELNVLRGAGDTISKVSGMMLEISFVQLYESAPLFHDVLDYVRGLGFTPVDFIPGIHGPEGNMLQGNLIVTRVRRGGADE